MSTFAVVASRATPTNTRLGVLLSPAQAVARLRPRDVALGRLDVLGSLDGIEPGLWALDLLERRGIAVLNSRDTLATAHDKLATADALACAGIPHPPTAHVAPWLPLPRLEPPLVLKPRYGSRRRRQAAPFLCVASRERSGLLAHDALALAARDGFVVSQHFGPLAAGAADGRAGYARAS